MGNRFSEHGKRLTKLRALARPFLCCQVGSGQSALFWFNDWTLLGPLLDLTGPNGPRVSGIPRLATVSQAVGSGFWILPRGRHPIVSLLRSALPVAQPISESSKPDQFLWKTSSLNPPAKFSASKTWNSLHPLNLIVDWHQTVWFRLQRENSKACFHILGCH